MSESVPRAQTPRDPGLQGERTALAWNRTALAVFVNALLALRTGWVSGQTAISVLGIILMVAAAAASSFGAWRRGHLLSSHAATALPPIAVAGAAFITLVASIAALWSIVLNLHDPAARAVTDLGDGAWRLVERMK